MSESNAGLRILLVEDNPDDALLVREMLSDHPELAVRIEHCETLAAGLHAAASDVPDLILLDLSLPDSSGLETLEAVRNRLPDVPLVIMTGLSEDQQGLAAVRSGAQDYIVKGQMDGTLIIRTCRYAVERYRFQRRIRQDGAQLRLLTAQMPAVMWTTDRSLDIGTMYGSVNDEHLQTAEDLVRLLQLDDPASAMSAAHRQALTGELVATDLRSGRMILHARIEPLRGENQHVIGTAGVAMDVTAHVRREHDLQLAREIQQALLPNAAPQWPGLELAGLCHFADATGGDFFDYLYAEGGRPTIVIGDVSGHGFGPAILTAATHSYLRALTQTDVDMVDVLRLVNRLLIEDTRAEQFVTLGMLELDLAAKTLRAGQAGHAAAILIEADGRSYRSLKGEGPPLGWFADAQFHAAPTVQLEPGMTILQVTDGIVEARSPAGEVFGFQRMIDFAAGALDLPAAELVQGLIRTAIEFTETDQAADDMTAVALKVTE